MKPRLQAFAKRPLLIQAFQFNFATLFNVKSAFAFLVNNKNPRLLTFQIRPVGISLAYFYIKTRCYEDFPKLPSYCKYRRERAIAKQRLSLIEVIELLPSNLPIMHHSFYLLTKIRIDPDIIHSRLQDQGAGMNQGH